jgi:Holliday junction DNA helicase RuvB
VRDWALVHGGRADHAAVQATLELYDVDDRGLDRLDRAVLDAILIRFEGGPVGLSTLAASVGEEPETVENVVEPFLVRTGLVARTPRGRIATAAGWRHVGRSPAPAAAAPALFDDQV